MSQLMLIHPNPKKRRSAAQRAATARMLAANRAKRGGGGGKKSRKKYTRKTAVQRTVYRTKRYARRAARRGGRILRGFSTGSVVPMVKSAGIGAAGAIGVDIAMGYATRVLPASVASPVAADGGMNYGYYATKGALAIALGVLGRRVISPSLASKMAEGSLTVTLYNAAKGFIPTGSVPMSGMGYPSSAMIARGGNVRRISEYVNAGGTNANRAMRREMGEYVGRR